MREERNLLDLSLAVSDNPEFILYYSYHSSFLSLTHYGLVKKTPFHSCDVTLKDKIDQMVISITGARQQINPPYSQHVMARLNEQLKGFELS